MTIYIICLISLFFRSGRGCICGPADTADLCDELSRSRASSGTDSDTVAVSSSLCFPNTGLLTLRYGAYSIPDFHTGSSSVSSSPNGRRRRSSPIYGFIYAAGRKTERMTARILLYATGENLAAASRILQRRISRMMLSARASAKEKKRKERKTSS